MNNNITEKFKAGFKTFNWKWFAKVSAILLFLVVLFEVSMFSPLNRQLLNVCLFHPAAFPTGWYNDSTLAGIKAEDVTFPATDGKNIHGWFFKNPKAHFTVLLSHGNGGNLTYRLDLISLLLKSGTSVFAYDYEGFGKSEGVADVDAACDDSRCAYQYLLSKRGCTPEQIVLCGESLGTGITGRLAERVKSAGVILQCPFISVRQRAVELLPIEHLYPQICYPENALDNSAVFSKTHAPLLIIGGVVDHILPIHHADQLFQASIEPKTYIRVDGAGHTGDPVLMQSKKYSDALRTFLASIDTQTISTVRP